MAKACLRCGTVNASNAKFCSGCGNALSRTQAGRGTATRFCKKCRKQVRVRGKTTGYPVEPGPTELYWKEYEYYDLACGHIELIGETGKTKIDDSLRL